MVFLSLTFVDFTLLMSVPYPFSFVFKVKFFCFYYLSYSFMCYLISGWTVIMCNFPQTFFLCSLVSLLAMPVAYCLNGVNHTRGFGVVGWHRSPKAFLANQPLGS